MSSGKSCRSTGLQPATAAAWRLGDPAVERAAQRRKLDLVVLACDLDEGYAVAVEKILVANSPEVQVLTADLSVRDLGGLVGTKRAGCVGLVRGARC